MSLNFFEKPNFQNDQKSRENGTNMDRIFLFLAKPLEKHGITLMHITYRLLFSVILKNVGTKPST